MGDYADDARDDEERAEVEEEGAIATLSPELREIVERARAAQEAAGYLIPDEAEPDEPDGPDEPPRTVDGGVALCLYCGSEIPSLRHAYRRVRGWERQRRQGGTNAVRVREPLDEFACGSCVDALADGRDPRQGKLA